MSGYLGGWEDERQVMLPSELIRFFGLSRGSERGDVVKTILVLRLYLSMPSTRDANGKIGRHNKIRWDKEDASELFVTRNTTIANRSARHATGQGFFPLL